MASPSPASLSVAPATELAPPPSLEHRLEALEAQTGEAARLIAELRARDRLKTQFLSNISHDLRTPLTAIITHAEILRDGMLGELSERQMASVSGIIKGGHQLLQMVGEILAYARGAADQLTLTPTRFALAPVVEQLLTLNQPLAAKRGVRLGAALDAALPAVTGDREKLSHVLSNLVGNAIHFTGLAGGGSVQVHASVVDAEAAAALGSGAVAAADDAGDAEVVPHDGEWLLVRVSDTGIGIAPEHHELVFREFAQVDSSASRRHHGTGLGLAIARKLVELHGGRIWVESTLGEGADFAFLIPQHELPPADGGTAGDAGPSTTS